VIKRMPSLIAAPDPKRPLIANTDVGDATSEAGVIWIIALFLFFYAPALTMGRR